MSVSQKEKEVAIRRLTALVTLILRSRRANRPASVQTALMSAPDRSSLARMYSSRSTSSPRVIRDVCRRKMCRLVCEGSISRKRNRVSRDLTTDVRAEQDAP